jgi:predicted DCC family thiol-disulfide oxidoreductase YuxK
VRCARWLRRRDRAGRVLALHNRTPGLLERLGLTRAQVDESVWVVEPGGAQFGGAAAANRALAELGGGWPLVARAYRLPPVRALEELLYRWVARHRPRMARFWADPPEASDLE